MFDVGQCLSKYDHTKSEPLMIRHVVWTDGHNFLSDEGEYLPTDGWGDVGFGLACFSVAPGVYTKLQRLIEGVMVSEFMRPGDTILVFADDYAKVSVEKVVEVDYDRMVYKTESGSVIPFGSIMGVGVFS